MSFSDLGLTPELLRAVADKGYDTPSPIQLQAIPAVLAGRDVLAGAQTGTGKTAGFVLPILQRLAADVAERHRAPRALVLTPTRELAAQVAQSVRDYGKYLPLRVLQVFGGVGIHPQISGLRSGCDILVATPGRLLDLVQSNALRLNAVECFVLDEADRMLDMGFIHDIRKIVSKLPASRQTLMFSATMPHAIAELAAHMLRDPVRVAVAPAAATADRIEQHVIRVDRSAKPAVLAELLQREGVGRALIFTRTKHGADKVVRGLVKAGVNAAAIHGNKSQSQRERVLAAFRQGEIKTLVATDIAARGIDVDGISHVVNFDLPNVPETYVHRIGRTARAGAEGIAISLCDAEEVSLLRDIEKLIRISIAVTDARGHRGPPEPAQAHNGARPAAHHRPDDRGAGNRRHRRNGDAKAGRGRRDQPAEASSGIAAVAFLHRTTSPRSEGVRRPSRWAGHSKGS